jgi:predicted esterase
MKLRLSISKVFFCFFSTFFGGRNNVEFMGVLPIFILLLFFGAMFWAKSGDPFVRTWLKIGTASRAKVECVVVLPKPLRACPVVIYLHGSGGVLLTDGRDLRQLAELGMAAVSLEYNQTNYAAFEDQLSTLLEYLQRQPWALSNSQAWVGFSQGAQNELRFLLKHPEASPRLMVSLADGLVPGSDELGAFGTSRSVHDARSRQSNLQFLLVHGDRDEVSPVSHARELAEVLATNWISVDLKILPGLGHTFEPDRALLIRKVGEYVKAHLTPEHPQPEFTNPKTIPFLVCALPSLLWLVLWVARRRKKSDGMASQETRPTGCEIAMRVVVGVLAVLALTETAIHVIAPHFFVNDKTLAIARKFLVQPKERADFEFLAVQPIWQEEKLKTLLEHVELASYNRELINWKLDDKIYRDYVLSPVIVGNPDKQLNWRRPLWEFYYPRIQKENTTEAAAEIIERTLRERVTVWPNFDRPQGIEAIWRKQITGEVGFEIIYVATLRSVGVPARLNSNRRAEFWDGDKWKIAPQSVIMSW